ncbi:nucleotidyltransferase family protein [Rhodospirillum rubrum]|uniref:Nucleotidyl transferase n=1 Tax=Rhodospirillum rubrum (strain ATCC 11170 / ATH 1.1.1 / DSM 467 / LMG 4362 / NCIMB 8255 / S1) TaxID=269796 RepID=Q2RNR5_RHORT|nr:nucleotidyltransferase family protein [Rhodospirillum rubrum]ABC24230.1 Nucleotidyl transferase [Rhodospirillum rubrum ATCC 11170]AEO49981.1 nucleotidyl transferase [Rhodospirillum rubrum F11]MBK5955948.1 mannose-1-phosphate guanylyltransferase [Rhodospirillum rubrum]QXG80165.1 nucleotidyltransferase family protein [Rhodospirillum rubrum]HAP99385.1 nucleotidyltransferase family protein [Rhodospirillum rubrum]
MAADPASAPVLLHPRRAMVLAAGLGLRMRPLTETMPKPLVAIHDKPLIDWALDHLATAGVEEAVVNLHHLPEMLEAHLQGRATPRIHFSDETGQRLETGGGVRKALPHLGDDPFYVLNSDVLWLNGTIPALDRLAAAWDPETMDALLLLHPLAAAHGYEGLGDFDLDPLGRPTRRAEMHMAPFIFTGVQILHPRLFDDAPEGPFSLNVLYDRALSEDRLAAIVHDGEWYHVGTPQALVHTETILGQHSSMSDQ